jgi:hypothetical protein
MLCSYIQQADARGTVNRCIMIRSNPHSPCALPRRHRSPHLMVLPPPPTRMCRMSAIHKYFNVKPRLMSSTLHAAVSIQPQGLHLNVSLSIIVCLEVSRLLLLDLQTSSTCLSIPCCPVQVHGPAGKVLATGSACHMYVVVWTAHLALLGHCCLAGPWLPGGSGLGQYTTCLRLLLCCLRSSIR